MQRYQNRNLRVLVGQNAVKRTDTDEGVKVEALTNTILPRRCKTVPLLFELAIRRIMWLIDMIQTPNLHTVALSAMLGTPDED